MRRLALMLMSLALTLSARATTRTVPTPLNSANVQATVTLSASGDTIIFPAGTYSMTSPVNAKCGVTYSGAGKTSSILSASFTNDFILKFPNCYSGTTTVTGLQFLNTGGIYVTGGSITSFQIDHNWFKNLPESTVASGPGCCFTNSAAIFFDGGIGNSVTATTIDYNTFGDSGSCPNSTASTKDYGGYCTGVFIQAQFFTNSNIYGNSFTHLDEGAIHVHQDLTYYCPNGSQQSVVNNVKIYGNLVTNFHRIGIEIQAGTSTSGGAGMAITDNVVSNPLNPGYYTFGISMAGGTEGNPVKNLATQTDPNCHVGTAPWTSKSDTASPADTVSDNLVYDNTNSISGPLGIEFWGAYEASADHNAVEGPWANGVSWGYTGDDMTGHTWYVTNNYICATNTALGNPVNDEEGASPAPVLTPNNIQTTCSALSSGGPTVSITGPTGGDVVTMTDTAANTSIYYTVDGTTPVPANAGLGSTFLYGGPFGVSHLTTVKAVGFWGHSPQPLSYPAGYGYSPSAVVTKTAP